MMMENQKQKKKERSSVEGLKDQTDVAYWRKNL